MKLNPELVAHAVEIDSLEPHPENRRVHSDRNLDALQRSLQRFGQQKPIVFRAETRQVIAGNGTMAAAVSLGWTSIAAVPFDCDEETARGYALADNRVAELADWDWRGVAEDLETLLGAGYEPEDLGWQDYEIEPLMEASWNPPEVDPDFVSPGASGAPPGWDVSGHGPRTRPEDQEGPQEPRELGPDPDDQLPEIAAEEPERPPVTQVGDMVSIGDHVLACGDCVEVLAGMDEGSVDAIVTDPPYGIGFMGRAWDALPPGEDFAREALRVLKPGGHLIAFGGTRTIHRLTCALEDAGFEIRDQIAWLQWQGFPKSLDVSKAIDRRRHDRDQILQVTAWIRTARDEAGLSNADLDAVFGFRGMAGHWTSARSQPSVPTLEQVPPLLEALGNPEVPEEIATLLIDLNGRKGQPGEAWFRREVLGTRAVLAGAGFGDVGHGLRSEPDAIVDTAPATADAARWEGWGTALKPAQEPAILARKPLAGTVAETVLAHGTGAINVDGCRYAYGDPSWPGPQGRDLNGGTYARTTSTEPDQERPFGSLENATGREFRDPGGRWPANVFHSPKPARSERDTPETRNLHPTVKPVRLMRWLVRLVTPPGGVVVDPFAGSGTTLVAAEREGFRSFGIELEPRYCDIARARIAQATAQDGS